MGLALGVIFLGVLVVAWIGRFLLFTPLGRRIGIVLAVLAAGYGGASFRASQLGIEEARSLDRGKDALIALADSTAAQMAKSAQAERVRLRAAREGKLAPAEATALVSVVAPPSPEVGDGLGAQAGWLPIRELFGAGGGDERFVSQRAASNLRANAFSTWDRYLSLPPWQWPERIHARPGRPDSRHARYLAVTRIVSLRLPSSATLQVRVVDASSGGTLCEGWIDTRYEGASGRGYPRSGFENRAGYSLAAAFGWGIQLAPLDVLCESGGPRLCEATLAERAFVYDPPGIASP
ncbi:MAG: hypothetical protein ACYC8T_09420 [Myxococcaceae bacterium]